ncbi:MAG: hypothetical protein GY770_22370 [Aestuariibacter sp.]|nr:hypothetical protein [Aestuariibacter sp.]
MSEYFPVSVSYAEAMRHLVSKANACLPLNSRIYKLAFDRAGWNAELLQWLQEKQAEKEAIIPITWVKRTSSNVKLLDKVDDDEFVPIDDDNISLGKKDKQHVVNVADTHLDFPKLERQRVVILETNTSKRVGIYTTAPHPRDAGLFDKQAMNTIGLIDTMRHKQRIENRFKVEKCEMDSDALPSQKTHQVTLMESYDLDKAQKQVDNAQRRLDKYATQEEKEQQLHETKQLDTHQACTEPAEVLTS